MSVPLSDDEIKRLEDERKRAEEAAREAARRAEEEARRLREEEQRRLDDEAKRIAAEEMRRAEERRKADEEALKRAEDERRKREQELREALRLTDEQRKRQQEEQPQGGNVLTCLDAAGNLTTDRAACDPNRTRDVVPASNLTPEQQAIVQKRAEERFLGGDVMESRRQEILTLIEQTRTRLVGIRDSGALADQGATDFLNQSIEWLGGAYGYFTAPERTTEDIAMMRTYLTQIIDYTEMLLTQARASQPVPEIANLVTKVDRILGTFPDIFWILTREGVAADPKILDEYGMAAQKLSEIKERCPGESAQCSRLSEVIGHIESMQGQIQAAVAASGKPQVEGMIREAIQAKMAQ